MTICSIRTCTDDARTHKDNILRYTDRQSRHISVDNINKITQNITIDVSIMYLRDIYYSNSIDHAFYRINTIEVFTVLSRDIKQNIASQPTSHYYNDNI